jgi:hypothetical protein
MHEKLFLIPAMVFHSIILALQSLPIRSGGLSSAIPMAFAKIVALNDCLYRKKTSHALLPFRGLGVNYFL